MKFKAESIVSLIYISAFLQVVGKPRSFAASRGKLAHVLGEKQVCIRFLRSILIAIQHIRRCSRLTCRHKRSVLLVAADPLSDYWSGISYDSTSVRSPGKFRGFWYDPHGFHPLSFDLLLICLGFLGRLLD